MITQHTKYKRILTISCFVFLLLLVGIYVQAQSDTIAANANYQSAVANIVQDAPVSFRIPSEDKIIEYQKDSRFQYGNTFFLLQIFQKVIYWIGDLLDGVLNSTSQMSGLGRVLVYILATILIIVIVVFIIVKVKGIDVKTLFGKKKIDTPEIEIYTENVHEMNFDTLISNALKNTDYRLATRFMYLKNLKRLTDNGFIKWNINKTNYSYQHEIKDPTLRSKFLETTFIFDYVWYGEFSVDESQFATVEKSMDEFGKMAGNEK